jgi:hypothetical protein
MNGSERQAFYDAPVDYRHTQLMAEVAQFRSPRRIRRHWFSVVPVRSPRRRQTCTAS